MVSGSLDYNFFPRILDSHVPSNSTSDSSKFDWLTQCSSGVNTGFGGSADTRSSQARKLQRSAVQHQNVGIIRQLDLGKEEEADHNRVDEASIMPPSWVRAMMLLRANSLLRGHSAVRLDTIDNLLTLVAKNCTPIIPLRGSISASGDLQPLSYLCAVLQGNPDVFTRTIAPGAVPRIQIVPSPTALRGAGLSPVVLQAKEALGMMNGTAASTAVASLAIYEANNLAVLTQILTSMICEALRGNPESYHPFISAVRPARGQAEAAANISAFMAGSRFVGTEEIAPGVLAQDRYALRTAPQWIGPQLEDLLAASQQQLGVEINATTDNPLIDVANGRIRHGGNFQAASVTSAMEKSRLALQMLGKLIFAQTIELVNPTTNKGLPPNLSSDDPSLSFAFKGVEISLAAYQSELAFLANPVSTHVQSAEMHNQAVNSLALISARYTMKAVELLSMMCAAALVSVCQALDLRALQSEFKGAMTSAISQLVDDQVREHVSFNSGPNTAPDSSESAKPESADQIGQAVLAAVQKKWEALASLDVQGRAAEAASAAASALVLETTKVAGSSSAGKLLDGIAAWEEKVSISLRDGYIETRHRLFESYLSITPTYLGQASDKMYRYVRQELGVPFHRGLADDPVEPDPAQSDDSQRKSLGTFVSRVYEAIRKGKVNAVVIAAVCDTELRRNNIGNRVDQKARL
jgi:phenylalanine ammonia-lyase